jgi:general secretion pathway protein D
VKSFFLVIFLLFTYSHLFADTKKINLVSNGNLSLYELINRLCIDNNLSFIIQDKTTQKFLEKKSISLNIKDITIKQALKILLDDNDIFYNIENNILKLKYLSTKTFKISYLNTSRTSTSKVDISLKDKKLNQSKVTIMSNDKFDFWLDIEKEVLSILNDHCAKHKVKGITINKNAGLITVTATKKQLTRVEKYLNQIRSSLHKQVSIDVRIYSVALNQSNNIGINWANINRLQAMTLNSSFSNQGTNFISLDSSVSIDTILDFLKQNGEVNTISNPKLSTLNNQPAIISVGEQINYISEESSMTTESTTTSTKVESMFSGVILDITASINEKDKIILKINPSISSVKPNSINNPLIPPTLIKKELSSVIIADNLDKIVLGGLIDIQSINNENSVVGLSNIPIFGNLFASNSDYRQKNELVIIIIPTII